MRIKQDCGVTIQTYHNFLEKVQLGNQLVVMVTTTMPR
jgi:hypothetical protein